MGDRPEHPIAADLIATAELSAGKRVLDVGYGTNAAAVLSLLPMTVILLGC